VRAASNTSQKHPHFRDPCDILMLLPDRPSLVRKILLAPATLVYGAVCAVHRAVMRLNRTHAQDATRLPLVVIGSLRAGGAGKTPVTLQLARELSRRGLRTGVLVYALAKPEATSSGFVEIHHDSNWRASSDEAVLLARELHAEGVRVFATRYRAKARATLARTGELDVLISDDGLMDPRLAGGVLRVALIRPHDNPGFWDLLPAGAWRLPTSALHATDRVDVTLREGEGFTRTTHPPTPENPSTPVPPVWVLAGLGNPEGFLQSLHAARWNVAGVTIGPDHGLPDLARGLRDAQRAGVSYFVCSAKDAVKMEAHPLRPSNLQVAGETVTLSDAFLRRVATFLAPPTS
jgi:tetraacyldisaccharide 4'-kinase